MPAKQLLTISTELGYSGSTHEKNRAAQSILKSTVMWEQNLKVLRKFEATS